MARRIEPSFLVGSPIRVWWADDCAYYEGTVAAWLGEGSWQHKVSGAAGQGAGQRRREWVDVHSCPQVVSSCLAAALRAPWCTQPCTSCTSRLARNKQQGTHSPPHLARALARAPLAGGLQGRRAREPSACYREGEPQQSSEALALSSERRRSVATIPPPGGARAGHPIAPCWQAKGRAGADWAAACAHPG